MERDADLINWCDALAAEDRLAGIIKDALRLYKHLAMHPTLGELARTGLLLQAIRLGWVEINSHRKPRTEQGPPEASSQPPEPSSSEHRSAADWDAAVRDVLGIG